MIRKFFAENFCSIKNRIDISFEASALTDETYYNNFFDYQDDKILKVVSFYGMNASGKSTITRAFAALRELIVPTPNMQQIIGAFQNPQFNPIIPYFPFEFCNETKHKPISLGIEFSLDNDANSFLYKYSVTYDRQRILDEKFEKKTSQKDSLLFKRATNEAGVTEINVGSNASNIALLNSLADSVMPNRTFLSMFNVFKVPDFYDAYQFFADRLVNISPEITRFHDVVPNRIMANEGLKKFTIKLLKAADFNISDINVKKTSAKVAPIMPGLMAEKDTLFMVHEGDLDTGSIEFLKESLGTKKIVILAEHLYPVLSKPSVLIIDELESSLHPDLTRLIVTCFLDETINVHNSQLIFTSHETSLLDLDLLRRDEINFVYKDKKTCATYIRSLNDFHVRKTDSIEKSYLAGRYLTSPDVNNNYLMEN